MRDRGIDVDHSTIGRWVTKYSPEIISKAMHQKKTAGKRWRMDIVELINAQHLFHETYAHWV